MSFMKNSQLFLCFIALVSVCFGVPVVKKLKVVKEKSKSVEITDSSSEEISTTELPLETYPVNDESCPGRGLGNGPMIMESVPGPRIAMEPAPAVLPRRAISEDSILSKPLEEFVREKRQAVLDIQSQKPRSKRSAVITEDSAEPTTTTTPKPIKDESKDVLPPDPVEEELERERTNTSEVLGDLELARAVDLCFLVDVTGSMSPYILGVRDSINDIVDDLLNSTVTENYVEDLRISFVGYRDFGDGEEQFAILPFTYNVSEFRDFVADTEASGGHNIPEDVFGGLDEALKLNWGNESRTRLIFHIADAPGHGCELHLLSGDDFPGGDPKERTAEGLFGEIKDMNIQFFFGNITADTDVMIDKFSEVYGSKINTFDIGVSSSDSYAYGGFGLAAAPAARGAIYESVKSAVEYSVGKRVGKE